MRQKSGPRKPAAKQVAKDIRHASRKHHSAKDRIRFVLDSLHGKDSIAAICRREAIAESLYNLQDAAMQMSSEIAHLQVA